MAGNVYFFTKMTDETGTELLTAWRIEHRTDGQLETGGIVKWLVIIPEKAHRNGNARFTIFTKDEDIEIKWLKSKFFAVKKILIYGFSLKLTFLNDLDRFIFIDSLLSCGEIFWELKTLCWVFLVDCVWVYTVFTRIKSEIQ